MATDYHHGDLRRALIDAAVYTIQTEGMDGLTLRGLAEKVRVSRTAPYRHFADKEALLSAVAAEGFERLGEALETALQAAATPEALHDVTSAYIQFAITHPAHYRVMYGRDATSRRRNPALQAAADALHDLVVALIARLQEQGTIREFDAAGLSYVLWSAVHGQALLLIEGQMEGPPDLDAQVRLLADVLLDGLRSP